MRCIAAVLDPYEAAAAAVVAAVVDEHDIIASIGAIRMRAARGIL